MHHNDPKPKVSAFRSKTAGYDEFGSGEIDTDSHNSGGLAPRSFEEAGSSPGLQVKSNSDDIVGTIHDGRKERKWLSSPKAADLLVNRQPSNTNCKTDENLSADKKGKYDITDALST